MNQRIIFTSMSKYGNTLEDGVLIVRGAKNEDEANKKLSNYLKNKHYGFYGSHEIHECKNYKYPLFSQRTKPFIR